MGGETGAKGGTSKMHEDGPRWRKHGKGQRGGKSRAIGHCYVGKDVTPSEVDQKECGTPKWVPGTWSATGTNRKKVRYKKGNKRYMLGGTAVKGSEKKRRENTYIQVGGVKNQKKKRIDETPNCVKEDLL